MDTLQYQTLYDGSVTDLKPSTVSKRACIWSRGYSNPPHQMDPVYLYFREQWGFRILGSLNQGKQHFPLFKSLSRTAKGDDRGRFATGGVKSAVARSPLGAAPRPRPRTPPGTSPQSRLEGSRWRGRSGGSPQRSPRWWVAPVHLGREHMVCVFDP